jgi:hypothetical protein
MLPHATIVHKEVLPRTKISIYEMNTLPKCRETPARRFGGWILSSIGWRVSVCELSRMSKEKDV